MKKNQENVWEMIGAKGSQGKGDRERNKDSASPQELKCELWGRFQSRIMSFPFTTAAMVRSMLRLQKMLTSRVLHCGKKKVWLDLNGTNEIANANSC